MIRVLVAEDSVTTLDLLVAILSADPEIEIVGTARNGEEAVDLVRRLAPDIVTMDIQMPILDGFAATKRIMTEMPTPIVIVSAVQDEQAIQISMNALQAGALTVLPTPVGPGAAEFEEKRTSFVRTIKAMAKVKVVRHHRRSLPVRQPCGERIIAIGASTGGPAALARIIAALPPDFDAPILVVQHMAEEFIQGFSTWLSTTCQLPVKIAEDGEVLQRSGVYLSPERVHLGVEGRRIRTDHAEPIRGFRPSATHLFRSVARSCGDQSVGVILTGMGEDGSEGLEEIGQAGGHIIAQDEATSVVWGMPKAAIERGVVDQILSLDQIAEALMQITKR